MAQNEALYTLPAQVDGLVARADGMVWLLESPRLQTIAKRKAGCS